MNRVEIRVEVKPDVHHLLKLGALRQRKTLTRYVQELFDAAANLVAAGEREQPVAAAEFSSGQPSG